LKLTDKRGGAHLCFEIAVIAMHIPYEPETTSVPPTLSPEIHHITTTNLKQINIFYL
jgi:hypothetical protein